MKPLDTRWTKHLTDPDRREDFEKTVRNSTLLFKRIIELIGEMEQDVLSAERNKTQYENPAWNCLQAHRNGNLETLKKLKDLFSIT